MNRVRVQRTYTDDKGEKQTETRVVQEGMRLPGFKVIGPYKGPAKKTDERPLNEQPKSKLQDTRNDVLEAFMRDQGIDIPEKGTKEDYIKAIKGE